MKKTLWRKSLSLSIITVFFGITLVPAIGITSLSSFQDGDNKSNSVEDTIVFSNLTFSEKEEYIDVELNGSNSKAVLSGKYAVPSYNKVLKFPFGTTISNVQVIPKNFHYEIIKKDLITIPDPYIANIVDSSLSADYKNKSLENDKWFDFSVCAGLEGLNRRIFLKVIILPVKYHISVNIIEWIESATIRVDYEVPTKEFSVHENYSFIILTPKEFEEELNPLIGHKNNMGFSTKLITLDDIYGGTYFAVEGRDDQERIKFFIKNAVENWGTYYVLFVGGKTIFPVRFTQNEHPIEGGDTFACDLYYADIYNGEGDFCSWDSNTNNLFGEFKPGDSDPIDEVDLYPDVYLGRLACVNEEEVNICVNKIIKYETGRFFEADWFSNMALIGGDTAIKTDSDPDNIYEGEYITETIFKELDDFNPIHLWVSNGELKSIFPTGNNKINKAIESGCGFSLFSGHGYDDVWGTHPHEISWMLPFPYGYWIYHINRLKNLDRLTIVISDACKNANFNCTFRDDCWLWAFIANPYGGAVAGIGNTGTVHLYGGKNCIEGLNGYLHLKTMIAYREDISTIGEMWAFGINNYKFDIYNPSVIRHYDYRDLEMWHLLGDPSLKIKNDI